MPEPFTEMLSSLVDRVDGALGAAFVDSSGEAVERPGQQVGREERAAGRGSFARRTEVLPPSTGPGVARASTATTASTRL